MNIGQKQALLFCIFTVAVPIAIYGFCVISDLINRLSSWMTNYTERERERQGCQSGQDGLRTDAGIGLLEAVLALALFAILTAFIGQSLVSVMQKAHEDNASSGVIDLMNAEANYYRLYTSYPTAGNATKLSDCPASGPPTATQACLVSRALTQAGSIYNNYSFNIVTPPDAGYLITAFPQNVSAGRLSYCAAGGDGLLHGIVTRTPPALSTAAACNALPAIAQGANNATTTAFSTSGSGLLPSANSATFVSLALPAGSYTISAPMTFSLSKQPSIGDATHYVTCSLMNGGTAIPPLTTFSPNAPMATGETAFSAAVTLGVSGTISLSCSNHEDGNAGQVNNMIWAANLLATPVTQVVSQ